MSYFKPRVCQNVVMHALPTARKFSLSNFYFPADRSTSLSLNPVSILFLALGIVPADSRVGPLSKLDPPGGRHKLLRQVPVLGVLGMQTCSRT